MRNLHPVKVGQCVLDGKHIYIQSMLNTRSDDIAGSVAQAKALEAAGCEIVRAAIPNMDAVVADQYKDYNGSYVKKQRQQWGICDEEYEKTPEVCHNSSSNNFFVNNCFLYYSSDLL